MRNARRGGALLAVLWLSLALGAVAFALSRGVRADFDRAALNIDSTRAYYLAHGAIEATLQRIAHPQFGGPSGGAGPNAFRPGVRFLRFAFATGTAEVEIIGESGKLDVNQAPPEALARLLTASGVDPAAAVGIAAAIVDYRERIRRREVSYGMRPEQLASQLGIDGDGSAFPGRAPSIQEVEELLAVPGVTPDLLWGGYREDENGRLVRFEGLAGNLTTRGGGRINVNYASREMLLASGMSPNAVGALEEIRRDRPLTQDDPEMGALGQQGQQAQQEGGVQLGLGGQTQAYTLRATAELTGGRARRTVAALVEVGGGVGPDPIRIVRWYDTAF